MCDARSRFLACIGILAGLIVGICPVANTLAAPEPDPFAGHFGADSAGEKTRIVYPAKHVEPSLVMESIYRAFPDIDVTVDEKRRQVVVIAPQSVHKRLRKLIDNIDKPAPPRQVAIKILHLVNMKADSVLPLIVATLPNKNDVQLAVDHRTNSLLAVGPEGKLKVIEAVLNRLDQAPDRDLDQPKKTYRVRVAWFVQGDDPGDKVMQVSDDLQPLLVPLSKLGVQPICQVGQSVVRVTPDNPFNIGCSTLLGEGPANILIDGKLDMQQGSPLLQIEISAKRDQASGDANHAANKPVQLVNLDTTIVARLGQWAVLGMTPAQEKPLAFAVQVQSGD